MTKTLRCETRLDPVTKNVGLMLKERCRLYGARPAFRQRAADGGWRELHWDALYDKVARVGASLLRLGFKNGCVASYSRNREEMLVFELAAMSLGGVACPIFSEYPSSQLEYILEHSNAQILAVSDEAHLREALKTQAARRLKKIFVMDSFRLGRSELRPHRANSSPYGARDWTVSTVRLFEELYGASDASSSAGFRGRLRRTAADAACLLMYTSGTTGRPKGVVLSHRNILSQRSAMSQLWDLGPRDRFLSYLPWHHSFGGIFELFGALHSGACLTLDDSYGREISRLIENFREIRPTVYFSVPRIYQALVEEARRSPRLEREIFHPGLRFVFTAAAPMPKPVSDYLVRRGIAVVEGWGLTETSPCVTVTRLRTKRTPGLVGFPIPGVEIKLASNGEILVRGPNVMLGYHKDPKRTSAVLDPAGWFHTGDFGTITRRGLMLKGRIDGMFKLTTGQMVISQNVESALCSSPLIEYAVALGNGKDYVGAVVYPNFHNLEHFASERGLRVSGGHLLSHPAIRRRLQDEVRRAASAIPEKYARPKAFVVAREEPNFRNGEITPTLKVVRSKVVENYAPMVRAIFKPGVQSRATREVIRL
ncbi:MAG: AMP-binding protein [Elusimicrobia bacterium]|nr:AMP-binding protein [Elusimicrobiota bacterium]